MLFMMQCDFDMGSLKIDVLKVLFLEGGGGKDHKHTLCTLSIMLTTMNDFSMFYHSASVHI